MQMINVLQRLAELDTGNPNVKNPMVEMPVKSIAEGANLPQLPELNDLATLKALSGYKKLDECGPMGIMGGAPAGQPASFSINASAASGDEVAGMLTQIMNLAGVVKGQPEGPQSPHDGGVLTSEPEDKGFHGGSEGEVMRGMMDKMNDHNPEDEGTMDLALGEPGAAELGTSDEGPVGGEESGFGGAPDVGDMADEVRDMADQLADTDKEELGLESYDNTPNSPLSAPQYDANKMAFNPNAGGHNKGVTNAPSAMTLEDQLYAEYKAFVSEGKDEFGRGKNFAKIARAAGGGEKGNRIAGAVRANKIKQAGGKVKYAK